MRSTQRKLIVGYLKYKRLVNLIHWLKEAQKFVSWNIPETGTRPILSDPERNNTRATGINVQQVNRIKTIKTDSFYLLINHYQVYVSTKSYETKG
jgi:hypothetical protein